MTTPLTIQGNRIEAPAERVVMLTARGGGKRYALDQVKNEIEAKDAHVRITQLFPISWDR